MGACPRAPMRSMSLAGSRSKASPVGALEAVGALSAEPPVPPAGMGGSVEEEKVGTRRRPRRRTVTDGALTPWGRETAAVDSESLRDDAEEAEMP